MQSMITVSQPDFGPAETAAAQMVLESQWVGMGPHTEMFETALASFLRRAPRRGDEQLHRGASPGPGFPGV